MHDAIPLGLVGTPLVDNDEEVLYCFIPMEQIRLYSNLVTQDNLLWLCNDMAIIECGSRLFRFIGKFPQACIWVTLTVAYISPPDRNCGLFYGICNWNST